MQGSCGVSVLCVCLFFLLLFAVVFLNMRFSYNRDMLMNIRGTMPVSLIPEFLTFEEDIIKSATRVKRRSRARGRRAGALHRWRKRGHRVPLPAVCLSNVRSLSNKIEELNLLLRTSRDFRMNSAFVFTETWLNMDIPDSAVELPGFNLIRADRDKGRSGKTSGGGLCCYINLNWCTDVSVLYKHCCPLLEFLAIDCRPFYAPREFASVIFGCVYIPPEVNTREAQYVLTELIINIEDKHPDSVLLVMGDLNACHLKHDLPKYKQLVVRLGEEIYWIIFILFTKQHIVHFPVPLLGTQIMA